MTVELCWALLRQLRITFGLPITQKERLNNLDEPSLTSYLLLNHSSQKIIPDAFYAAATAS